MDTSAVVIPPYVGRPLRLAPFHGLRLIHVIKDDLSRALDRGRHASIDELVGVDAAAMTAEDWPA